jgi:hypothetical protein
MPTASLLRSALFPIFSLIFLLLIDAILLLAVFGIGDVNNTFEFITNSIFLPLQFLIFGLVISLMVTLTALLLKLRKFTLSIEKRLFGQSNYIYGLSYLFTVANFIFLIVAIWSNYHFSDFWAVVCFFCALWLAAFISILPLSYPEYMKLTFAKAWPYVIGIIFMLLALTNPTAGQFKNYADSQLRNGANNKYRRISNFIFFSLFEEDTFTTGDESGEPDIDRYLGICGNFFEYRQ